MVGKLGYPLACSSPWRHQAVRSSLLGAEEFHCYTERKLVVKATGVILTVAKIQGGDSAREALILPPRPFHFASLRSPLFPHK